jgi:hypothetical protein
MVDCFRKTVAQDGAKALFRGFWPAMIRAFPANAATFVSFPPFQSAGAPWRSKKRLICRPLQLGVEVSLKALNKL